jgi:methyltransferase (TIGR00027 family)
MVRGSIDKHVYTALPIAASRALANAQKDAIIQDPLAQKLLAGHDDLLQKASANTEYMTMRCLIGDDLVLSQHANGVRQVVSLGAGMDSRAFRLPIPGTTVFEVDKEDLFRLKEPLVQGVPLTCHQRVAVTGVLGEMDLVNSLEQAGFDPSQPTTWLLEGLLPYLSRSTLHSVAKDIGNLSAPGSGMWGDSFSSTSVRRGMVFHGVEFVDGCDNYQDIFRSLAGFDNSIVRDFCGIWLDRNEKCVKMNDDFILSPETTKGRDLCLMVQAFKATSRTTT